jgi:hypothetical protein
MTAAEFNALHKPGDTVYVHRPGTDTRRPGVVFRPAFTSVVDSVPDLVPITFRYHADIHTYPVDWIEPAPLGAITADIIDAWNRIME